MSILKWLRGLFPSDESERERGYEYCMVEIRKGRNIEELEILSDDQFNFSPFDAGMKDALWDWRYARSSFTKDTGGKV